MTGVRRILAFLLALAAVGSIAVIAPASAAAAGTGAMSVSMTTDLGAPATGMTLYLGTRSGSSYTLRYQLSSSQAGSFTKTGVQPGTYGVVLYDAYRAYGEGAVVLASATVTAGRTAGYRIRLTAPFAERRSSKAVDTGRRSAVQALYDSVEPLLTEQAVTSARPASCVPGGTAASTRSETLRVLNAARSLAGLDAASWSSTYNTRAERAAMLMAANKKLSHHPSSSWRCFDAAGADAAGKSVLASGVNGAAAVVAYLDDPGSLNTAVGHRRALLNPSTTTMGSGNSGPAAGGARTNAIYTQGVADASASKPRYTSWPSSGYFPWQLEPAGRWSVSVSRSDVTFEAARITVTALSGPRKGQTLSAIRQPIVAGMGLNTVSFQVRGLAAPTGAGETHYGVTVTGLRQRGVAITDRVQYTVRFFNG